MGGILSCLGKQLAFNNCCLLFCLIHQQWWLHTHFLSVSFPSHSKLLKNSFEMGNFANCISSFFSIFSTYTSSLLLFFLGIYFLHFFFFLFCFGFFFKLMSLGPGFTLQIFFGLGVGQCPDLNFSDS